MIDPYLPNATLYPLHRLEYLTLKAAQHDLVEHGTGRLRTDRGPDNEYLAQGPVLKSLYGMHLMVEHERNPWLTHKGAQLDLDARTGTRFKVKGHPVVVTGRVEHRDGLDTVRFVWVVDEYTVYEGIGLQKAVNAVNQLMTSRYADRFDGRVLAREGGKPYGLETVIPLAELNEKHAPLVQADRRNKPLTGPLEPGNWHDPVLKAEHVGQLVIDLGVTS